MFSYLVNYNWKRDGFYKVMIDPVDGKKHNIKKAFEIQLARDKG